MTTASELSPMSMAQAAYTAAVAMMHTDKNNRNREDATLIRAIESSDEGTVANHVGGKFSDSESRTGNDVSSLAGLSHHVGCERIDEIWKSGKGDVEKNLAETLHILVGELDSLVQCGLGAFYDLDATARQLSRSREYAVTKTREAQRLHSVDDQTRASLSCLLRAVESSKADARDTSRSAQVEARLRTNISSLRDERDKALRELSDCRRKQCLLEEELRTTKANLSRITQEKTSMERDSRAAIFLARSLDNNNSNDMNYYKRKVGELSDKLQSQQDLIMKQNNTIVELRGQNERSTGGKRFRESC
ncbi:hypothetical protein ACHAW5_005517 [Stephanodiscus triporus]|uniref:Uncharacterized protein n=1 Tax=Stephanodiscus triporus TaxID=2934178 RepID=A0ABD3PR60_9STRA